jgi:hypothetical protein
MFQRVLQALIRSEERNAEMQTRSGGRRFADESSATEDVQFFFGALNLI